MRNNTIYQELDDLVKKAETLSFGVASSLNAMELHKQSLELIVGLSDIKKMLNADENFKQSAHVCQIETEEVRKVARRLKRWANNQSQINARILIEYIKLKRDGVEHVTEGILKANFSDDLAFNKNFPQMKIIAANNHGKIFDIVEYKHRDEIVIWEPVKLFVDEFGINTNIFVDIENEEIMEHERD